MSRPPDLARTFSLTDRQWEAWGRLQRGALKFGASFLVKMTRSNEAKDAFFLDAIAFAQSFQPLRLAVKKDKKRGRKRA